jgi:hypothetical protein
MDGGKRTTLNPTTSKSVLKETDSTKKTTLKATEDTLKYTIGTKNHLPEDAIVGNIELASKGILATLKPTVLHSSKVDSNAMDATLTVQKEKALDSMIGDGVPHTKNNINIFRFSGPIRSGARAGCPRCLELSAKGKSVLKHAINCTSKIYSPSPESHSEEERSDLGVMSSDLHSIHDRSINEQCILKKVASRYSADNVFDSFSKSESSNYSLYKAEQLSH